MTPYYSFSVHSQGRFHIFGINNDKPSGNVYSCERSDIINPEKSTKQVITQCCLEKLQSSPEHKIFMNASFPHGVATTQKLKDSLYCEFLGFCNFSPLSKSLGVSYQTGAYFGVGKRKFHLYIPWEVYTDLSESIGVPHFIQVYNFKSPPSPKDVSE